MVILIATGVVLVFFTVFTEVGLRWKVVMIVCYGSSWVVQWVVGTELPIAYGLQVSALLVMLFYFKYLYL